MFIKKQTCSHSLNNNNNKKTQKLLMQVLKTLLLKTIRLFYYVLKRKMNKEFININFKKFIFKSN
jgi:hypothetical protein